MLGFIGVKMIAEFAAHEWLGFPGKHLVPVWVSLSVIAGLLTVSILASVIITSIGKRRESETEIQDREDADNK